MAQLAVYPVMLEWESCKVFSFVEFLILSKGFPVKV